METENFFSNINLKSKTENENLVLFSVQSLNFRQSIKEFKFFQSTKTSKKRYPFKYKIKLQTEIPRDNVSNTLPSNLKSFRGNFYLCKKQLYSI